MRHSVSNTVLQIKERDKKREICLFSTRFAKGVVQVNSKKLKMKAQIQVWIAFCAIISCFLFNEGAQSISGIYFRNLLRESLCFTKISENSPS